MSVGPKERVELVGEYDWGRVVEWDGEQKLNWMADNSVWADD